jgi:hypothetical protein
MDPQIQNILYKGVKKGKKVVGELTCSFTLITLLVVVIAWFQISLYLVLISLFLFIHVDSIDFWLAENCLLDAASSHWITPPALVVRLPTLTELVTFPLYAHA